MISIAAKIQFAADMISDELQKIGKPVPPETALALATEMHRIWQRGLPSIDGPLMPLPREDDGLVKYGTIDLRGAIFSAKPAD